MKDELDPELREKLDERIDWINAVTERAVADDWRGVQRAILDLDAEHLRGLICVLGRRPVARAWAGY